MATNTKLILYQRALRMLGHRELSIVSEAVEARRLLDGAYDANLIQFALGRGFWRFASKTEVLTSSGTETFGHGLTYTKPTNYVRLIEMSGDEHFRTPMTRDLFHTNPATSFREDQVLFYASIGTIYLRYVSDSASYGADLTIWPESFSQWFSALLAVRTAYAITKNVKVAELVERQEEKLYLIALDDESAGGALHWLALQRAAKGADGRRSDAPQARG